MRAAHLKGFTLIELLIAILVFSILSVMAYSGLQSVLDVKAHTEKQVDRLMALQTAFTFLQRDVEQTLSRGARDSFGDAAPALRGGGFGSSLLELTRAGVLNPTGLPRSSLQRVAYNLKDNTLARWTWLALDQATVVEPMERALLDGVKEARLRFLDQSLQWQDSWPQDRAPEKQDNVPRAVEITLVVEGIGEVKRLFRVPPGQEVVKSNKPLTLRKGAGGTTGTGTGSGN